MKKNLAFNRILQNPQLREELFGLLRSVAFFSGLSQEELLEVLSVMQHVLYSPREVIFTQESRDRNLHLLLDGEVFLYVTRLGGAQDLLARIGPRSAFGEIAFVTGSPRTASAMAGPAGSEHLVLTPEEFNNFLSHHPEITFKTMSGMLKDIGSRASVLPTDLANYAIWGYMRQHDPAQVEKLKPNWTKRGVVTFLLLVAGTWAGLRLADSLVRQIPAAIHGIKYFRYITAGTLAFAGTVLGFFLGTTWDWLERGTARNRRSERSCMNCKYIHWDEVDMRFRCVYKEMQMSHTKVELGEDYDTFTSCPSFAYKATAKIKMKERDGLKTGRD